MAAPETKGRMLNQDISESKNFAKLSPAAAVLFCMIIPHLNSYGKMNGGVGYIKEVVCPRIKYISERKLPRLLHEIDANTNVKWFKWDGRHWIHSINFLTEHQNLRKDRLGKDLLPSYSGTSPGLSPALVHHEVEVEVEGGKGSPGLTPQKILDGFKPTNIQTVQRKYGFSYHDVATETEKFIHHYRAKNIQPTNPQAAWELWMLRQWEYVGSPDVEAAREKEAERIEQEIARQVDEAWHDLEVELARTPGTPEYEKAQEVLRQFRYEGKKPQNDQFNDEVVL